MKPIGHGVYSTDGIGYCVWDPIGCAPPSLSKGVKRGDHIEMSAEVQSVSGDQAVCTPKSDVSPWRQLDDPVYTDTFEHTNSQGHLFASPQRYVLTFIEQVTCPGP